MLEQLRDEYAILHGYVKAVRNNLRRLEDALPGLKNASKAAAKAHLEAQAARDLEDTFGQLVCGQRCRPHADRSSAGR